VTWTANQIGAYTAQEAQKTGADPLVLLAMFDQEAGMNPGAIGDHGTSFGLEMLHIGGALGTHTKAWALNPVNAITDAARRLAHARTGADVAAIQRPADPKGYARSIDAKLAALRKGKNSFSGGCKQAALRTEIEREVPKRFSLRVGSGDRSPAHNAQVGGVEDSDHLSTKCETWARDFNGASAQLYAAKAWLEATYGSKLKQVLVHDVGSGLHLHVAGYSDNAGTGSGSSSGSAVNSSGSDGAPVTSTGLLSDASGLSGAVDKIGRYVFTIAIVVLGGVLLVFGATRTFGAVGSE
jgi:hypothetical protein